MFRYRNILQILPCFLLVLAASQDAYANDEFRKWLQQEQGSFQEYKDKRDKEFTSFLKNQWKEMQLLKGFKRDDKPKPVVMPVAQPQPVPAPVPQPVPDISPAPEPAEPEPVKKPEPVVQPEPVIPAPVPVAPPLPVVKPVLPPEPVVRPEGRKIRVDYYGSRLTFYYDPGLKIASPRKINETTVSDYWSSLSRADYDALIGQINASAEALQLNDWAYAVLTHHIADRIYSADRNSQSLFTWFVLTKAGYRARIAYNDYNIYLLVPTEQQLYSVPYFTFDDVRYYAVSFDAGEQSLGQVYTYDGNYPGANKVLNMQLRKDMVVESRELSRTLSFEFEGKQYIINAFYDKDRVDFLNTYPQLDLELYFKSYVSPAVTTPLQAQLKKYISGMSEQKAVNFLLKFVQTSLRYKTDEAQFGKENYLFPEETLYYPYSDCEDRSVMFAWLVKTLLGLDVVGLDYPGHVAAAVSFDGDVAGDAVMYEGRRYVVADPTYINATLGMTMPDYRNTKPGVIKTR